MYIDFDEYPPYSGRISEIFEKNINDNTQCDNGYAFSSREHKHFTSFNGESLEMMKDCFPVAKQIKKPKNTVCK